MFMYVKLGSLNPALSMCRTLSLPPLLKFWSLDSAQLWENTSISGLLFLYKPTRVLFNLLLYKA